MRELRAMRGLYDRLYRLQAGEVTERRHEQTSNAKASSTALASPQGGG